MKKCPNVLRELVRAGPKFLREDHGPKCDWLLNFEVSQFTPPMSEAQITRSLEAYILWLLGKVMFTENHQTTISRRFIPIALEIAEAQTADDIIQRSWGSAVLAATYRGLCNACTLVSPKSGLLGCPLLLQLWSWERFPIGRPDIDAERPFGANELDDPDHIDIPTFGILWTRRERRFARDHLLPPRPSTQQQRRPHLTPTVTPRPPPPGRAGGSSWQQHTPSVDDYQYQQHGSRPRLTPTATPRPPPPDQAGGSSWQQHHTPSFDDLQYYQQQAAFDQWQQQQAPFMGGAGYTQGYTQHTASNPSWGASDQDPEHMEYYSTQQNYVGMQTPPPEPTQETQYDPESGSWIPARITRAPDRFGWTPRATPPPRNPRRRP
nr:uncharacterized protein LOC127315818 [Lolium perenne]